MAENELLFASRDLFRAWLQEYDSYSPKPLSAKR